MKIDYTMWILIGGVISILGAGIAAWASYKSSLESGKQTDHIIKTGSNTHTIVNDLKQKNIALAVELNTIKDTSEAQLQQIRDLTSLNVDLSTQLAHSTEFVSQSITGGNGFCELDFVTMSNSNFGKVFIKNHGRYPLHDFKARVCELEEFDLFIKNNPGIPQQGTDIPMIPSGVKPPDFTIDLGTILVGEKKELPQLVQLGRFGRKSSFNIFINGKNGNFCQLLRYYKMDTNWLKATLIKDLKNSMVSKTLYENIDEDFPKDKLNWK